MRIVTVTNQKGGVGKTTLVCHLALAGVERGLRTLVVDLDTQGNASTMLARDAAVAQQPGGAAALFAEAPIAPTVTAERPPPAARSPAPRRGRPAGRPRGRDPRARPPAGAAL